MASIHDHYDPTSQEREEHRVYHENRAIERRRGWKQLPRLTHMHKPPKDHPSCDVCFRKFNRKVKAVMNYCICNFFMCCECTTKCRYICPVCKTERRDQVDLTDL